MNNELGQNSFRNNWVVVVTALAVVTAAAAFFLAQESSGVAGSEQPTGVYLVVEPQPAPVPVPGPLPEAGTPAADSVAGPAAENPVAQNPEPIRAPAAQNPAAIAVEVTPEIAQLDQPAGSSGGPLSLAVIIIWSLVGGAVAIMLVIVRPGQSRPQAGSRTSPALAR